MSKAQLLEQIKALPREEKLELLEDLLLSLEQPTPEEHGRLWAEEAMRRYQDLKSGKEKGLSYEEFMRDV
ncbi:MAG: addiction module protein [Thermaceae bacterium]|nr:addiction module protein [Thermaceae bacterium]